MNKSGIADYTYHLALPFLFKRLAHAVRHADAGAHANAGMQTL
ncbi:MAG: hypothetical protein BWY90_01741 [Deltaproteobacteria bacterium ADurb.BinA014]|nr:MAG: hypothetical protein BWY90_01741 [Deltaproteobacteria bacterium ADurb.BinA014]